jgi:hypothetical protein
MAKRWIEEVRQFGELTVFAVPNQIWDHAFFRAFALFNMFSVARDIGVILKPASSPPNPNGPGAHVQFSTFTSNKFDEGHTDFSRRTGDPPDRIAAAFISVPSNPQTLGQHPRNVGEEPKVLMVAHELVHACGLDNSEHTPDANPDVFSTGWIPDFGNRPEDDGLHLGQTKVPPLVFSVGLAHRIRQNWK